MLFRTATCTAARAAAVGLAAIGLAGAAAAQNNAAPPTQPARAIPQFQVEVLIFTHRDFDRNEEQFAIEDQRAPPPAEQLRETSVFDDPDFASPNQSTGPLNAPGTPHGAPAPGADAAAPDAAQPDNNAPPECEFTFRVLRPEELQLTNQYRVLNRLQAYHPLVHGGWVQQGLSDNDALPVDLGVLGIRNPIGTIRLSLSRFLHVKLDLSYVDAQGAQTPFAPAQDVLTELPVPTRYHLTAERRISSGELHYFDHPAFGVLIKITPVKQSSGATRPAA